MSPLAFMEVIELPSKFRLSTKRDVSPSSNPPADNRATELFRSVPVAPFQVAIAVSVLAPGPCTSPVAPPPPVCTVVTDVELTDATATTLKPLVPLIKMLSPTFNSLA